MSAATTVWDAILSVFNSVADWFRTAVVSMIPIFYDTTNNNLTVIGTLAVVSLGISITFLLVHFICQFFRFSGN